MNTGVYRIRNKVNGKVYVGSAAVSLRGRMSNHRSCLRGGYHVNTHLQRAWDRYGEASFEFTTIERCPPEKCVEREQYWIDLYNSTDRKRGYNRSPTAGSTLGVKHSEATRKNMSAAMQRISGDISERMRGNQNGRGNTAPKTESHKAKIAAAARRQFEDPEARRQMSDEKKRLYEKCPEVKERIAESLRGRKQSEETKAKRAASLRGKKRTPEQRARMSEAALKNRENRRRAAAQRWYTEHTKKEEANAADRHGSTLGPARR